MQLIMPDDVRMIIDKLQEEGYEAFAVGGCVRDSYLGKTPHDWDITTNALPEEVKSLFRRTIDVGIQHGTVVVMVGDEGYEITTYRIDGEYEDNRHPKEVVFTASLAEDLRRRDFTINAMAYSEKTGIVDLFGGIDDLKRGIIRAVGNPRERFSEDALRILRAIRFSARFGYEIEEQTKEAIKELAPTLSNISAERIRDELEKMIMTDNPDRMRTAYELGVTKIILPEWDAMMECEQNSPYHYLSVGEHTIKALEFLVDKFNELPMKDMRIVRIATLLHDVAKPSMKTTDAAGVDHFKKHPEAGVDMVKNILRRLKYDNETIDVVTKLVRYHDLRPRHTLPAVRRAIIAVGIDNIPNLMIVKQADMAAQSNYHYDEKMEDYNSFYNLYLQIYENNDPLSIKDLAVTGRDLMEAGVASGPEMGIILNGLLQLVIDNPRINNKESLMDKIEMIKRNNNI